jgi:hypothetical protein
MRMLRLTGFVIALTATATPRLAHAVHVDDLSMYFGTERATLGTWFGKLALGDLDTPALPAASAGVEVRLVTIGRRLHGIDIEFPEPSCDELTLRLAKLWGPATDEGWQAKSSGQGAKLEPSLGVDYPCKLRFFRRVSPEQWLNTSRHSVVPLWAIGKPAAELESVIATLQPEQDQDTGSLSWKDTAIDGSRVSLTAYVRDKRIAAVGVSTEFEAHDNPYVWKRLRAMFGKPDPAATRDDSLEWRWRGPPRIVLDTFVGDGVPPTYDPRTKRFTSPRIPAWRLDDAGKSGFPLSIVFGVPPTEGK